MNEGYLKCDRAAKKMYLLPCWHIVDAEGRDLLATRTLTEGAARYVAKAFGIKLLGELK